MFTSKIGRPRPAPAARCDLFVVHTFTSPHSGSPHMIYKKLPNPEIVSLIAEELFHMHCNHYPGLWPARLNNSMTRRPQKLQLPVSMHFFFVLTPPLPSTLQHFLFRIFFNFSRLPSVLNLQKLFVLK